MYLRRAITRALSFSLSFFSPFLFVFHVDRHKHESPCRCLLVHTHRPKDRKIRCSPAPWFSTWRTTEKTSSTFLLDDNITEIELSSLWNSRGRYYDYWSSRARGGCPSRGRTEEKQNEVQMRWLYVEKKSESAKTLFFARDEANNVHRTTEERRKIFSILRITVEDLIPCFPRSSRWPMNSPWK